MTVRINFLPPSYQPPRKLGPKDYLIAAAAATVFAGGGFYYTDLYADVAATQAQVQATQQQIAVVQVRVAELEDLKAREQRVAQAEAEMQALKGHHWSPLLLQFRDLTPQQMYWTDFQVENGVAKLSGNAASLMDISQFLIGLMVSPSVLQVDLQAATEAGQVIETTLKKGEGDEALPTLITADYCVCRLTFEMTIHLVPVREGGTA